MKYVLVCKNELRGNGYRCADVFDKIPWEPAPDHMWVECPDDFVADSKWYDPSDETFKDFPPRTTSNATTETPATYGVQTL